MTAAFALLARLALLLVASALPAAAQVPTAPVPDWVDVLPVPDFPDALLPDVKGGEAFLLVDHQIRFTAGRKLHYFRYAVRAETRGALESVATVAQPYDPLIETLSLLHMDIRRGDRRIALADRVQPEILRREVRLDEGVLDGTLTAHWTAPGVEVGDVLDVALLWESGSYVPGTERELRVDMEYTLPVALTRFVLHWPAGPPPRIQAAADLEARVDAAAGGTRYEWRRGPLPPQEPEPGTADEHALFARVLVSPHADWEAVTAPLAAHYAVQHPVPEAWAELVEQIRLQDTATRRAYAALRLVQDRIRYVGLEVGAGGYFARPPAQVVAQGFGDCKDKAVLLVTLLRALDIEAQVALASTAAGHGLIGQVPRMGAFDHMIVRAKLSGGWVFMDPTVVYEQGIGPAASPQPNLGWVLPVTPAADDLEKIRPDARRGAYRNTVETFTFTPVGVRLEVVTDYGGAMATRERSIWDRRTVREIARGYLDYYEGLYPGIVEVRLPQMATKADAGTVTVSELYLIPRAALRRDGLIADFPFQPDISYSTFPAAKTLPRRTALAVEYPSRKVHLVRIRNAPISFQPPDGVTARNEGFMATFGGEAGRAGNLDLRWTYQSLARSVPAAAVGPVLREAEEMDDLRTWYWDMSDGDGLIDRLIDGLAADR